MQNNRKASSNRRIDLYNCKLLFPYGRNAVDNIKIGAKVGGGGVKVGFIGKIGILGKPGVVR
jgi:hypothetical protein